MSLYVLDTDTLTLLQAMHPAVLRRVRAVPLPDRDLVVIND